MMKSAKPFPAKGGKAVPAKKPVKGTIPNAYADGGKVKGKPAFLTKPAMKKGK